jgi:preprotein translocase subunit SecB
VKRQIKKIESLKEIAPLIAAVQIRDIRLVEAGVSTSVRSATEAGEIKFEVATSADVKEYNKDEGIFWVLAQIKIRLIPVEPEKDAVVSVSAAFEIKYSLPKELRASQKQLNTFARINGVFNAWPYWREFVQNMVARMNLPTITLPVFRLEDTTKIRRKKPDKNIR